MIHEKVFKTADEAKEYTRFFLTADGLLKNGLTALDFLHRSTGITVMIRCLEKNASTFNHYVTRYENEQAAFLEEQELVRTIGTRKGNLRMFEQKLSGVCQKFLQMWCDVTQSEAKEIILKNAHKNVEYVWYDLDRFQNYTFDSGYADGGEWVVQ